jgi:hypothetical protein
MNNKNNNNMYVENGAEFGFTLPLFNINIWLISIFNNCLGLISKMN